MWVSGFLTFCMAASLGEMCSVYPTVGGQYHFAALLSRPDWAPIAAWVDGWFAVAGESSDEYLPLEAVADLSLY